MKTSRSQYAIRRALVCLVLLVASALSQADLRSAAARVGDTSLGRAIKRVIGAPVVERGRATMLAPTVTATLVDSLLVDGDGDTKADPGDTIRYTATMTVTGEEATGVNFTDTIDANTALVAGSISISPLAIAESYQSVGNMTLTTSTIGANCTTAPLRSVLCNDSLLGGTLSHFGPDTGNLIVVNGTNTRSTTGGGTVLMNAPLGVPDGTFVYNPAPGFEGTDTFIYRLTSGGTGATAGTNDATVSIVVGGVNGMAWFVSSAGAGTGRQSDPISLDGLRLINNGTGTNPNDNDTIVVLEGAHALTATLTLRTNQKLLGQDFTGTTFPALGAPAAQPGNSYPDVNPSGTETEITSSAAAITLGSNNEIAGFTVGNNATTAIIGGAVGALNVREVTIDTNGAGLIITTSGVMTTTAPFTGFTSITSTGGSNGVTLTGVSGTLALGGGAITNPTGIAFSVSDTTATIIFTGTISKNTDGRLIDVSNYDTGTATFSGDLSCTSLCDGIEVTNNGGAGTVTFSGATKTLSTGASAAVTLDSNTGGSINFTGGGLDITTTSGTAFSASGGGAISVTGSSNDVTTTTGQILVWNGVSLGTSGVTFAGLQSTGTVANTALSITDVDGDAFSAASVSIAATSGLTSDGLVITGGSSASFAIGTAVINNTARHGLYLSGANGIVAIDRVEIDDSTNRGLFVENNSNTVTITDGFVGETAVSATTPLQGVVISGGTAAVTINADIVSTGWQALMVSGRSSSTVSVTGDIDADGVSQPAVVIFSNTGGTVTVSGALSQSGSATGVSVSDNSGGAVVTFSGSSKVLSTGTGTAVHLDDNAGATINFTGGGLDIDTTSGVGFTATGGGTLTVTGTGNDIATGSATALRLSAVTIGAAGMTFATADKNSNGGTVRGIDIASVTATGGGTLTVGSATVAGTGGTAAGIDIASTSAAVIFTSVTINGTAGAGIALAGNTGVIAVNGGAIGATNDPGGNVVDIDSGSANVTIAAALTKTTAGRIVEITNRTGTATIVISGNLICSSGCSGINVATNNTSGTTTINFSGGTKNLDTAGNAAVTLDNNDNATINFSAGGLNVDTTSGIGFNAINGAVGISVTGTGNTIDSTTGTALNVASTNIGASGLTFQSISSNGASRGIALNTTGSSGGLTVTGSGGTCTAANTSGCSGGTIQNSTGADDSGTTPAGTGIVLNSTANVSLARMWIHTHSNYGIRGTAVAGFTLDTSVMNGINGSDNASSASTPWHEGTIKFDNLTGSATISNTHVSGGVSNNIRIVNTSGTLDRITFTGDTIGANSTNNGEDGILLESETTGVIRATVQNTTFTSARGDLINFVVNASSGDADDLIFNNNSLSNNHPGIATGGGGTTISSNGTKDFTFHIEGNSFRDAVGTNVLLVKSTGPASFSGTFTNNTIGVAATANSGSAEGSGLKVQSAGQGSVIIAITDNDIHQYNNYGVELLTGGGATAQSGTFHATITGNTIDTPGNTAGTIDIPKNGIHLNGGTVPGDTYSICADIGGAGALANSIATSGRDAPTPTIGDIDFRLRQRQSTTVRLPGYGGGSTDNAAVLTFVQGRNSGNGAAAGNVSNSGSGGGFVGGAACTPPLAMVHTAPAARHASQTATPTPGRGTSRRILATTGAVAQLWPRFRHVADQVLLAAHRVTVRSLGPPSRRALVAPVATAARAAGSWHAPVGSQVASWASSQLRLAIRSTLAVVRRVPDLLSATLEARSGETVSQNIGTIPAGRTVTIVFDVTVDSPRQPQYSTQGTVSGSNFSSFLTDDPAFPGGADPTVTSGDLFDTTTTLDAAPPSPSFVSEEVTLTATVTSEAGGDTPSGLITFKQGVDNITNCVGLTLNGSGVGTCVIPGGTFTAGLKSFTAEYAGDSDHDPSVNSALSYTYDACTVDPDVTTGLVANDGAAGSLRHAIAAACPGSTITFSITGNVDIGDSGFLPILRDLTIDGPGAGSVTVRRVSALQFPVFHVSPGVTATIRDVTVQDGRFDAGTGGGIFNEGGTVTVDRVWMQINQALQGGAMANTSNGTLIVRDSTLATNTALQAGGAIANISGTVTVINSTISGNTSRVNGGGLYQESTGALTVINSTITNNRSDQDNNATGVGGGLMVVTLGPPAEPVLTNTLVAGNFTQSTGSRDDIWGAVDAASASNLIGDGTNMTGITHGANGNLVGSSAVPIDPLLGALGNNGGPTETHALLHGSPALDAGRSVTDPITSVDLATDQRGQPRPVDNPHVANAAGGNGSDIGALELPAAPATPDLRTASDHGTSGTDNLTNDNTPLFDIAGVTIGATVEILVDDTPFDFTIATGSSVVLSSGLLADGPHSISARQTVAGALSPLAPALVVTIDTVPPNVTTIDLDAVSDSGVNNSDHLTNATTRVFNIGGTDVGMDVSLLRNSGGIASITGTGGLVQLSDATTFTSGTTYAYTARQADAAGNFADSAPVLVTMDSTRPDVTIASTAGNPTATSPIPVTVTFTEDVSGFLAGDLVAANGTVGNFAGSGAAYTFDLTPTGEGLVTVDLAADVAIDLAGNTNTAATQFARTYDLTGPGATIAVTPDPRNSAVASIDIVFDGPVTGVTLSDFTLTLDGGGNLLTGAQTVTSSDDITWALNNLSGLTSTPGSYTLTLTAAGSDIEDGAGNAMTADATDTWVMETTMPTVTINQAAGQVDPASNASTVNFTTVFSEPINETTFTDLDLDLSSGDATTTTITITEIAPNDGTTFNVAFSGNSPGVLVASIPANAVEDLAGNLSVASTSTDNIVTVLACSPVVTVTSTGDSGPGTLRQALLDVCSPGTINFDLAGPGPHSITVTSGALFVDRDVTITGPADERVILDGGGTSDLMVIFVATTARIERLTFANGYTPVEGAAIFNLGEVSIFDSTFTGNVSEFNGGAITNEGILGLANSTVSGNSALFGVGGGIFNCTDGLLFLLNTTITNNQAGDSGGGLYNITDVYMENTILAGNTAVIEGNDWLDDGGGVTNDFGHNLVGGDPKIGPLANNGGPTQTHALLPGSPAIDAGDSVIPPAVPLPYDPRGIGFGRIRDGADANTDLAADIGAIEADPSISDIADKTTAEGTPFAVTFHVGDASTAFEPIVVSSSNTTLLPDGNLVLSQDSPSSWTLTGTPAANVFGTSTVTVTVSKIIGGAPVSMSDTFMVTVVSLPSTPTITGASTLEDTQTTSDLVISRNAADGPEITHFKITTVTGGTLFQSDGVTPIPPGAFITDATGAAGLRFLPAPHYFGMGTVGVRASTSASDAGLGGGEATATITIAPVADTPGITGAATIVNLQTTNGLVITRSGADGNEVTHVKVTAITNGALFQHDGVTPIALNAFITAAQGSAGLRFTPSTGSTATGQVSVRASLSSSDAGLGGGTATANITVTPAGTFSDDPLVAGVTPIRLVHLLELRTRVNAQRVRFGLAEVAFSTPVAGVSMITGQNLLQVRTALSEAYAAAGVAAPTFTDPGLPSGTLIKALHIQELRAAIRALELF